MRELEVYAQPKNHDEPEWGTAHEPASALLEVLQAMGNARPR